jgi:lipopolysaccharide export system protein LptA
MNRATGEASATGDVKSTYSELKPQSNGAMLASADPIHVTSQRMTAHRSPAVAVYTGAARLWQGANIVEAPMIQFDRDQRTLVAEAPNSGGVSTVLVEVDQSGAATPVSITSSRLTYIDQERKVHFETGVTARGQDATMTADQMDAYLQPRSQSSQPSSPAQASKVEKIVAQGHVLLSQPARKASGDRLVYTSKDGKFVLTGGAPSIFDAEHGHITGVSLTFYKRDDRVVVEGSGSQPTVTQTRVAR